MIAHTELKPGDACPIAYCTGKLYKLKPSAIFKIDCGVLYVEKSKSLLTIYPKVNAPIHLPVN